MTTFTERLRSSSGLGARQAEHLLRLCSSWQVLADLSFSDLLLYVTVPRAETFEICAQLRPFTSQTLYAADLVGQKVTQPEQPIVERAFREGRIWAQEDPVLVDGIPIRMDAVPVRFAGDVIAVLTREGSPATSRRPGQLERVYLQAAEQVSHMVCEGLFPLPGPPGEWPRVGDGLFVLDHRGRISWASPNGLSSLRRLGVSRNIIGSFLDDLGLGHTPVGRALAAQRLFDGELVRAGTEVLLRVMPLIDGGRISGALVLSRDVSEVRQKERLISVREATIREIHHRVKNNLQTIASLLRLQARRLDSEEGRAALQESVLRVSSIALVHETLSEELTDAVEFEEVVRRIAGMVADGLVLPERALEIKVAGSAGSLSSEIATPLAVALTELLHNAVEHAFPGSEPGTITVELARGDGALTMTIADDGIGVPEGALQGSRLGLTIVRSLVSELGGRLRISTDGGTRAEVRIPTSR